MFFVFLVPSLNLGTYYFMILCESANEITCAIAPNICSYIYLDSPLDKFNFYDWI